jgi:hypothetical protein
VCSAPARLALAGIRSDAKNPIVGYAARDEKLQISHRFPAPLIRHLFAEARGGTGHL